MHNDDLGLEYMKELKFKQVTSYNKFANELKRKIGKEKALDIIRAIDNRADNQGSDKVRADGGRVYSLMNADFKTAMAFYGMFEEDYLRTACNWYVQNGEFIKGDVLDIGCNNGILSCFVARTFPECHITAVDIEPSGLAVGKELAEKLGVNNIEFVCSDINEYISTENKQFDTIIASRTMAENREYAVKEPVDRCFLNTLKEIIGEYRRSMARYAKTIGSLLKDNGYMVSVERISDNEMMVGWILALKDNGLSQEGELTVLDVTEVAGINSFSGIVFKKEKCKKSDSAIIDEWFERHISNLNMSKTQFYHNDAQMLLEYYHYEQEDSILLVDPDGRDGPKICLSNGYLFMPEKRLVQYSINLWPGTQNLFRALSFFDEDKHEDMRKDIDNWKFNAFQRGLEIHTRDFGDPER